MSLQYSQNAVETKTIDSSRYTQNRSVEFSLDEKDVKYLSNMRLINLGATASNSPKYNQLGGAMNLINSITLFNGREELCSSTKTSIWSCFQQTRFDNSKNHNVINHLYKSDYGFQVKAGGIQTGGLDSALTTDSSTTPKAWVQLSEVLPLMEQMNAFDTTVFKNLRVLVEFETQPQRVISTTDALTTLEPSLIVDIVRGNMDTTKQVSWLEIESDQYLMASAPTQADTANVSVGKKSVKVMGFDNKSVERLLLVKQFDDITKYPSTETIKNDSLAVYREQLQVRVNGANIFPTILDKDATIAKVCSYSWGDLNQNIHFNDVYRADTTIDASQSGKCSYSGCTISDNVKDLQIEHNRSFVYDTNASSQTNSDIVVHVFGEVRKVLLVKGNDYVVQYA